MMRDCLRTAHRLGVPFAPPPAHPFNPLLALRVTCVAEPEHRRALVDALFAAVWATGEGIEATAAIAGEALVAKASTQEAKDQLRRNTDEAIAAGVFGVPTILAGTELFWGLDSLPNLVQHLRGADPPLAETIARWRTIRPSAQRKGS